MQRDALFSESRRLGGGIAWSRTQRDRIGPRRCARVLIGPALGIGISMWRASQAEIPTDGCRPRGLAGMGGLPPVLRLGERTDARAPRRPVLAAHGVAGTGRCPGAWLRHRPRLAADR